MRARKAALGIARRGLENTTVRAPHAGRVVGLTVSSGEMIAPAQTLFTLINTEEWFAVANFREMQVRNMRVGQPARPAPRWPAGETVWRRLRADRVGGRRASPPRPGTEFLGVAYDPDVPDPVACDVKREHRHGVAV